MACCHQSLVYLHNPCSAGIRGLHITTGGVFVSWKSSTVKHLLHNCSEFLSLVQVLVTACNMRERRTRPETYCTRINKTIWCMMWLFHQYSQAPSVISIIHTGKKFEFFFFSFPLLWGSQAFARTDLSADCALHTAVNTSSAGFVVGAAEPARDAPRLSLFKSNEMSFFLSRLQEN